MCRTANLIHRKKSEKDLTNQDIAKAMQGQSVQVSADMVQKYFSGSSGVPLENLGPFLRALGLKVVDINCPEIDPEEYKWICRTAARQLNGNDDNADT